MAKRPHLTSFKRFEEQLHTETLDAAGPWPALLDTYFELSRFYNAVGFGEMIYLAAQAVEQHPELVSHDYWIIDEYQDFNASEDHLIRLVTENAKGVLLAGDDEQALYQELKASLPDIIISYYQSTDFANAMLPYCSRCSYWICLAASAFIATGRPFDAIGKIYLPLVVDEGAPKVRLVATSVPSSAVAYVKAFIDGHADALAAHIAKMEAGEETDPFLLILTPQRGAKFLDFKGADDDLRNWLDQWSAITGGRSRDYRRVSTYYSAHSEASNNFAFRKVLSFEGVSQAAVHPLVETALEQGCRLSEVDSPLVASALEKCDAFAVVVEDDDLTVAEKVGRFAALTTLRDEARLTIELSEHPIQFGPFAIEEEAEEAIETAGAPAAVEMLTIVGSKGLSAKHVIVLGCDDVNLNYTSRLAFFVALTRARESLHLVVCLKASGGTDAHGYLKGLPEECCDYVAYKKTGSVTDHFDGPEEWIAQIGLWHRAASRRRWGRR